MDEARLAALRERFSGANESTIHDEHFAGIAKRLINPSGTRVAPFAGLPTLLDMPFRTIDWSAPDLAELDVALIGAPMDLGVTNRNGSRFGPRALRAIERIGPYNHVLKTMPGSELAVADIGDVPFRSRFDLARSHEDIEATIAKIVAAGVIPLTVGGDHSITLPILRAIGAGRPVGMIHIDAHCDTSGPFDGCKFHHGGPFRHAVLEGVLDPERTIQIGIRGSSEYLWEFSKASGMTVIHAEDMPGMGIEAIASEARRVVGDGPVYLSFDIDSLDPAFAPGTGTPEIGGPATREIQALIRALAGIALVGGDVVEVAPQYDATTNTAQAGAQMLFEILSLVPFAPSETRRTQP
ncbi:MULTISPECIES: agmatinase [unclassified Aureimonas]|uniref:agmatinase n=1 Tax=unclassified Aureimonas TaxID=2615206 RepID=UPI0006FACF33|nr:MULTISPECIES: agmatinase [unclassified Aureimonas]KQT52776.1 agmatinase [Aureimonas sp. Leaf427]KQT80235.1 agmatinase [Aureimonas sp. Leaf460]